jgi:hypothetical protein
LLPLDFATLLNNHAIVKVLLQNGANTTTDSTENFEDHIDSLLIISEQNLHQLVDSEKEKSRYENRIKLLKRIQNGWKNLKIPAEPFSFSIDVIGCNSVLVKILQPIGSCTKIKGIIKCFKMNFTIEFFVLSSILIKRRFYHNYRRKSNWRLGID